ncbi:LURP-one-related [Fragilaria crotonensis]|nr:LURP-one-related [Fragilaria crotonensis]
MCRLLLLFTVALTLPSSTQGWTTSSVPSRSRPLHMNILSDFGDLLSGGKLADRVQLPYNIPLSRVSSISKDKRVLAVQERAMTFTGEDFDVFDVTTNQEFAKIRGAMLHLPGKDKMRISVEGEVVAVLDRKLVAMTPTYDIYRGSEKMGWIEKEVVAFRDTFDVYLEGSGGVLGPFFKPPPAFKIEGDFVDRNFCMKNAQNQVVAKISKDWIIEFDAFNHYQVQVAPGMDAVLVIACLCAVDEEFDEEHKEAKKKKEEGQGGWF